jgi:hypothetical protein
LFGSKYHRELEYIAKEDPDKTVRETCLALLSSSGIETRRRVPTCPPLVGPPAAAVAHGPPSDNTRVPVAIAAALATPKAMQPTTPETSAHDALLLEQAELQEALLKSKADARNADGVVIMRLTAHSSQIKRHLLDADCLQTCFENVRSADCDVCPDWANGAIMLVPLTQDQVVEADIVLQPHNIVCLSDHVTLVEQALKQLRKRKSAQVKPDYYADKEVLQETDTTTMTHIDSGDLRMAELSKVDIKSDIFAECDDDGLKVEVQNTFLNIQLKRFDLSEASTFVQSAPAVNEQYVAPNNDRNPRRWKRH